VISQLLLVAGVGVLATALRTVSHPAAFRIGTLGLVATSFLAGWLLGGSLVLGVVFAAMWFLLPWLEILTRVRKLRLPLNRRLEKSPPPPASRFPNLGELTDELEAMEFEHSEDVDWRHDDMRQFYRLFYNAEKRTAAAVCLVEQGEFSFFYVAFTSHGKDGRIFMTWNYPFSYGMRQQPQMVLNRVEEDEGVEALAESHQIFLSGLSLENGALAELQIQDLREEFQKDQRLQIEHNIACGILRHDGDEMIRYSVRGMFFLWFQFLREFVRLS
jgi:hypothetical protein